MVKNESNKKDPAQNSKPDSSGEQPIPTLEELAGISEKLSPKLKSKYEHIKQIEADIKDTEQKLSQVKQITKPISRIDMRKGKKLLHSASDRKVARAAEKHYEQELFVLREELAKGMVEISASAQKTRNNIIDSSKMLKARSPFYAKRNTFTIGNKTKRVFDTVLKMDPTLLSKLKAELKGTNPDKNISTLIEFFSQNDETGFLSTVLKSHIQYQNNILQFTIALLSNWDEKKKNAEDRYFRNLPTKLSFSSRGKR